MESIQIYIAFNIFSCRILIVSYKMLIITRISNEKTNELTIYGLLCQNVTTFYRQELASLFQAQENLKACRNSKSNFSSCCFIANDSRVKIAWLHVVVTYLHGYIFCIFEIMFICLNIIQWKYLKTALIISITQIKPVYKFSNFRFR